MMRRRDFLGTVAALAATGMGALPARADGGMVDHETLAAEAARLARAPHRPTAMPLHGPFAGLNYDSHRAIRPRPGRAADLALSDGLRADLLPPGFLLDDRVTVHLDGRAQPFSADLFDFDARYFDDTTLPDDEASRMGFAGLRLRAPLNHADVFDDLVVFQGASYFRALARGGAYGLSARGLALDVAGAEEFPVFTAFHAAAEDTADGPGARIRALMESPSVTGAFSFLVRPGAPTVMTVEASLFPRRPLDTAGIAPLTSMFWFGPMRRGVADDYRPMVHDSDALVILNGAGERLWRPLANPAAVQVSGFADDGPRGFGLVQSRTAFDDFDDPEAAYHRRPSVWVEPLDDWGPGAVVLVEIPTADEFMDNIVAFWRPDAPLAADTRHDLRYRLHWGDIPAPRTPATVVAGASGRHIKDPEALTFLVDFDAVPEGARPDLQIAGAEAYGLAMFPVPEARDGAGVTRVSFHLTPGAAEVAELRLTLRDAAGRALSDTWLYRWTRARGGGL
ncbi:MAG: glucan biosynthesis protein [Alkalilacustris sp.]